MKKTLLSTFVMCLAAMGAMAQPAGGFGGFQAPQVKLETSQEWKDVNYAGDDKAYHTCDIYLPKKAAASYPVVIHIYGSAWFSNSSKGMADLGTIVKTLLDNGYAVVCPNHRSSMDAEWPAQINDIRAVIRFVRGEAKKYHFDPSFIATSGFSSGGHLSSTAATTSGMKTATFGLVTIDLEGYLGAYTNQPSTVNAACDWSGPVDLTDMDCGEHMQMAFESLVKYLNKQNVSVTVPSAGTSFQLGRADVEILGPIERSSDTNNNSIVTRVVFGNTAFLFMGDAEIEEENSLIEAGVNLSCDVLKAGHHGSNGSTGSEFLRKAAPDYAVFSVGSENSYGHPTDETLARLEACGVSIYRTDMQGDVVCQSDGNVITFVTEKKASEEALWIAGPSSNSTVTRDGVVVAAPEKTEIPEGTTFVLNTSSKKFHLTTCSSVGDISEKNRAFSTDSAEELIAAGYKPCGRCNPSDSHIHNDDSIVDQSTSDVKQEQQENGVTGSYVLNTKTLKFHRPDCSSVTEMNANNRKDVTMSREEIINQGYSPCKRCNP